MEHRSVGIYCFDLKDGKTPESRLQEAVKDWIRTAESPEWGLLAAESDGTIIRSSRGKPYLRVVPDWVSPSPTAALSGSALWRRESWGLICRSM